MPPKVEGARNNKRPRLEESKTPPNDKKPLCGTEETIQDPVYNASDAEICVIHVQNTTFKIHRFLLTRGSDFFRNSLALESDVNGPQGLISLNCGELEFRDLCWALYAMPTELSAQLKPDIDVGKVYRIAFISNKYRFQSIEDWAIETLIHQCRVNGLTTNRDGNFKPPFLFKVASICSSVELRQAVEDGLMDIISDISYDFSCLLEHLGLASPRFAGMVYYYLLQRQERCPPRRQRGTEALQYSIFTNPFGDLAGYLDRGFCSLSKWWDQFVLNSINVENFPRDAGCPPEDHAICQSQWPALFSTLLLETDVPVVATKLDILGRLEALGEYSKGHSAGEVNWDCLQQWANDLPRIRESLTDTMRDQFIGPPPPRTPKNKTPGSSNRTA